MPLQHEFNPTIDFPDDLSDYSSSSFQSFDDEDNSLMKEARSETVTASSQQSSQDAPEALVRQETRAVFVCRILVLLVLFLSAAGTSFLVYTHLDDTEQDAFESDFDSIARELLTGMQGAVALRLGQARTLSSALSTVMSVTGATQLNLTLPPPLWAQLTHEALMGETVELISWNPLLTSELERVRFETFASTQILLTGGEAPCFACPEGDVFQATDTRESQNRLFHVSRGGGIVTEAGNLAPYHAIWQVASPSSSSSNDKLPTMYNEMSEPVRRTAIQQMLVAGGLPVMSESYERSAPFYPEFFPDNDVVNSSGVVLYYPVLAAASTNGSAIVGSVLMQVSWHRFLPVRELPTLSELADLVVENSCGQNLTFRANRATGRLQLQGPGSLHNDELAHLAQSTTFAQYEQLVEAAAMVNTNNNNNPQTPYCRYRFHVFASTELEAHYVTNDPIGFAVVVAATFLFAAIIFSFYDIIVQRRQSKVMGAAMRTNAIVSELFPREVRDRLFERAGGDDAQARGFRAQPTKMQMQNFLSDSNSNGILGSEPIADFFPNATIMFLDIAGFTPWSSEREPSQVFRLLETIYQSFDDVAKNLGVFKVETIGDSYVAVCGLPTPRQQHAVIMAQFAKSCLKRMIRLTGELEKYLGPSTGELRARVGLHSGPITAGVLRGEKARFQLFGDTVNTAARLESAGTPHRIHASKETAELLSASGKGSWVHARKEPVHLQGKGALQTYWVTPAYKGRLSSRPSIRSSSTVSSSGGMLGDVDKDEDFDSPTPGMLEGTLKSTRKKYMRLVDWNVEVLYSLLQKLMESRAASRQSLNSTSLQKRAEEALKQSTRGKIVIEEMTQILTLPEFSEASQCQGVSVNIRPVVKEQLHDFVTRIKNLYRNVPFHNFEHASHVIMSAGKLMKRIVNPDGIDYESAGVGVAHQIHTQTYGICSDRMMQFAVVFSALIHDVDHTGLTNAELNKMDSAVSKTYKSKCVAEQNSVDVAWAVLMDERFRDLRGCIYTNATELKRFRQLIVNAVMATDIADKELKTLRESRWDDAFSDSHHLEKGHIDADRKATIVFEYIIQASDVAHTMQHWHTYQKFNRRLFAERYLAWLDGHAGEKDPSAGWYKGELWFFDNYIIPLAQKLDTCGVFGVSYDEYLNYAKENRKEWEAKGAELVAEMLESCRQRYPNRLDGDEFELSDDEVTAGELVSL